ncbi:FxSxx-COOH system tetratricopeptide repeat protein [Sinosporangium siamense]|uniref:ATP-binding protein n=1 Tax=Sinosporangium siamense TaxID=1367973 RepID=A0A919VBC7_9ACTN|nr:FxSxx-COOH system tetratricopeptide repeat protein [Sinosporangium siamense]GII97441.1 ATP-binding protein [Sinosporangium siamense]
MLNDIDRIAALIAGTLMVIGVFVALRGFRSSPPTAATGAGDPRPRTPSHLWNVPPRAPHFVGREDILLHLSARLEEENSPVLQALIGIGGVGKTTLAIEYAYRFRSFYDLVWWVGAEQAERVREQLAELAVAAGWAAHEDDISTALAAASQRLSASTRWLLIFDDAGSPESLREVLPGGPGHVVVTSRHRGWDSLAQVVPVGAFGRAESTALLLDRVPALTEPEADRLAGTLGDLPLAVAQAAGFLSTTGMPVTSYQEELDRNAGQVLGESVPGRIGGSLTATVTLAKQRLGEQDAAGLQMLELMAFLASDPVPVELFAAAAQVLPAPLSSAATSPFELHRLLGAISSYGLGQVLPNGFVMHRLTQLVLRGQLSEEQTARTRVTVATVLAAAVPDDPEDPAEWSFWALLLPHLLASELGGAYDPALGDTMLKTVRYLLRRGEFRGAERLAERVFHRWRAQLGAEHKQTLSAGQLLAEAHRRNGRYAEALESDRSTWEARRRLLGEEHLDTLASADGLAADLYALGRYDEAEHIDRSTHRLLRRALGQDHPQVLVSANNLARDLHALGRYDEARDLHEDVLTRRRRLLGDDHPDTLSSANNLALILSELGGREEAGTLMRDTFNRLRRILGEDHPDTLTSANNLARMLFTLGDVAGAMELDRDTFSRLRDILGEDHQSTLTSAGNLAGDLAALGDLEQARQLNEDTLARRRRVLGEDHPDTLASTDNLALNLYALGRYDQARALHEDALTRGRRLLGDDHPQVLIAANNLARDLAALGEWERAGQLDEDTLARRRRVLGEDHPDTLTSAFNLALVLTDLGRHEEAAALARNAHAALSRVLGDDHPVTLTVAEQLSETFQHPSGEDS